MSTRYWSTMVATLAAGVLLGCAQPFEVRPVPEPATIAKDIPRSEPYMPLSNALGVAQIVIAADCGLHDYSAYSFAWRGNAHVWQIRNDCEEEVEVRLGNFRLTGDVESRSRPARSGDGRESPPFDESDLQTSVPADSHRPLVANVRSRAQKGEYVYEITVDGVPSHSPKIVIEDP